MASILAKTGSSDSPENLSNATLIGGQPAEQFVPSSSPSSSSRLNPALVAEAVRLRSAMNAYLLSEILD